MGEDVLDVAHLVRRAPVQVGPAREQRRLSGSRRHRRAALHELRQAELQVVERQVVVGLGVEVFEGVCRAGGLPGFPAHREAGAAARNRHVERGFDLAQVGIERAAQPGEARIVHRVESNLDGLQRSGAR